METEPELWSKVDRYLTDLHIPLDPALDVALAASDEAGLPPIQVSPPQGKLLQMLAQIRGARRILEIGTLGGYSTIWLARALPFDGRLISLELNPKHAEVARANIAYAGLSHLVEVRVGSALDSLAALASERSDPFDLTFIDADKESTADYFTLALKLARPGSLIIVDNVVRHGQVADSDSDDSRVLGMRRFLAMVAAEPNVSATTIQTVGAKGYDGFTLALVLGN